MSSIPPSEIKRRLALDNPWWADDAGHVREMSRFPRRAHFARLCQIVFDSDIRRALVLMGPRRVGKTFLLRQFVAEALSRGRKPDDILYVSVDAPIYMGMSLLKFLDLTGFTDSKDRVGVVIFDEIQYLRDWEVHLKDLVDTFPNIKFVASGSAAAALRLKSKESGAGRFTDFHLPPLSFAEFIAFRKRDDQLIRKEGGALESDVIDLQGLNSEFIDYLNFGGFPELIFFEQIKSDLERYVRNDIVDKILLKDIPNLYGINDIQELNRLFSVLAFNDGKEISLEALSQDAQVSKPTIRRYIEYLESAYLISVIDKIDINARRFVRQTQQKIYLTNPCMRAALFGPIAQDEHARIGHLAEAACFAQLVHGRWSGSFHYARTQTGEIDMVFLDKGTQKPLWAREIKWSNRLSDEKKLRTECAELVAFCQKHNITSTVVTTRDTFAKVQIDSVEIIMIPTSVYCYRVAQVSTRRATSSSDL
jgi:uncharacterized protein